MRLDYPRGWYVYSVFIAVSSLLTLFGFHREFYSLLQSLSLPTMTISCLTGLTNLSWYELAYVIGGGMKNVRVFIFLPFLGAGLGSVSATLLLTRVRFRQYILLAFLAFCILIATLGLLVLFWRFWRGFEDYWRLVTTIAFLLMHLVWFLYFQKTRRFFSTLS